MFAAGEVVVVGGFGAELFVACGAVGVGLGWRGGGGGGRFGLGAGERGGLVAPAFKGARFPGGVKVVVESSEDGVAV